MIAGQPDPQPQPTPEPERLQWQVSYRQGPDGRSVCAIQVKQGSVAVALTLSPDDMEAFGSKVVECARLARTGLLVAGPPMGNGQHLPKG